MHSFSTLLRFIWRSSKRAAVFVLGVALVGVGLVMFVTPGPGIVLVVAGLAILATEFAWAEHLLDKAKESASKAGQSAQRIPGVSAVTSAAGRLVPARFRRTRAEVVVADADGEIVEVVDVAVVDTEVVEAEVVEAGGDEPAPVPASNGADAARPDTAPADAPDRA